MFVVLLILTGIRIYTQLSTERNTLTIVPLTGFVVLLILTGIRIYTQLSTERNTLTIVPLKCL